jgi:biopolymer transport protein ExbD
LIIPLTMQLARKQQKKIALNITSLIDVMFILIIFFTVSSTFLEQPGIELKLPEAESSETHTAEKVIVYVDAKGDIFLNKNQVSIDALGGKVADLLNAQTEKTVVLSADEDATHGAVVRVMDILRQKGIYKIIISTVKP